MDSGRKTTWVLHLSFLVLLGQGGGMNLAEAGATEKTRNRMEDLFLWKMSDGLDLNPTEEIEFQKVMKEVRESRASRSRELDELLARMESSKSAKEREELIMKYQAAMKDYNQPQLDEIEKLHKLLGTERLARYLILKERLTQKLKDALADASSRDSGIKTKVKDPKIIHDP